MKPQLPISPRDVADKARDVLARVRPPATHARRSLPIRHSAEDLPRLWSDADARAAVLAGIPVADAAFEVGRDLREWGTVVTVDLQLESPVPGVAAQVLAGKVVRRLKALAETGEVPTTAENPSARTDAQGEAA